MDREPAYKNVIFIDLERAGFFGPIAAVGVSIQTAVQDQAGKWRAKERCNYLKRCHVDPADEVPWYRDNILPALEGIPVTDTEKSVRTWWQSSYQTLHDLGFVVAAHVPFPVETGMFHDTAAGDRDHEYPLFDVASMLLATGSRTPTDLECWYREMHGAKLPGWYREHNPLADARLAAVAYWTVTGVRPANIS